MRLKYCVKFDKAFLKVDELPFGYRSIINNYKNYIW